MPNAFWTSVNLKALSALIGLLMSPIAFASHSHPKTADLESAQGGAASGGPAIHCGTEAPSTPEYLSESWLRNWDDMIWETRSKRPLVLKEKVEISRSFPYRLRYVDKPEDYVLDYDPTTKTVTVQRCFRYDEMNKTRGPNPAFRVQLWMLQSLAQEKLGSFSIQRIVHDTVTNHIAQGAIQKDFKKDNLQRTDGFSEMEFFRSPNGLNILDLIKSLAPHRNPFDLIVSVSISKLGKRPNVYLVLKDDLWVHAQHPSFGDRQALH